MKPRSDQRFKHGHARKHGLTSSEYRVWQNMKKRCFNPTSNSYKNYGARGITVCDEWMKFDKFILDMGSKPGPGYSIERIDNNKDYSPNNCKWATRSEQAKNRRNNIKISFNGQIFTLSELARIINMPFWLLRKRLKNGMSINDAINIPCSLKNKVKTHCKYGHKFSKENTYFYLYPKTGKMRRRCRQCDVIVHKKGKEK